LKRVILLADGTWNSSPPLPGVDWTNLARLAHALEPCGADGSEQVAQYQAGLGVEGWFDNYWRGYSGRGLERKIEDARRFVAKTAAPGDELWLFGLSRGGLVVRALCHWVEAGGVAATLRFVGVWDSVDALGLQVPVLHALTRPTIDAPPRLGDRVENAFHALALDERRKPFVPVIWRDRPRDGRRLEQVWFNGRHPDVCGGFGKRELADVSLGWMLDRARGLGLGVGEIPLDPRPDEPPSDAHSWVECLLPERPRAPLETNPATEWLHPSVRRRWENMPNALQQKADGRWLLEG